MSLLRRIFGQPKDSIDMPVAETTQPVTRPASRHLRVGHASAVGLVRPHNEDVLLIIESVFEGDKALETVGLFIVADGMGGHQAGEVASALAARTVARCLVQDVYISYLQQ